MKQKLLNSLRLQLCTLVACLLCAFNGQAWGESYNVKYTYSDLKDMLSGSNADASSYWKVPATAGNSATIAIPIPHQPTSDITITFEIATFGSGTNPSSVNTTITAVGTESGSNWSGSGVSTYPSSSSYVNGVMTITKPNTPTTLDGLTITMGVNSGVKIFRLRSLSISYTYDGDTPTPTTYTVTYNANGGSGTMTDSNSPYDSGATVTVLGNSFTREGYTFSKWNTAADGSGTDYASGATFSISANTTLYAQWTEITPSENYNWVLTDVSDLTSNDIFVIVGGDYAMTNNNGTSSAPATVHVTIENNKITSDVSNTIQWNINGTASGGYTFYPNGDSSKWLYCNTTASSGSNNNMRVGTGDRKWFKPDKNGYFVTEDTHTARYISIYNYSDWRGYTNTNSAVKLKFYKRVDADAPQAPFITADNVNLAYDATEGNITYTLNNPVAGGAISAVSSENWLTVGTSNGTVALTCSANSETTERTATVTLTYTYGNNETVTKEVTVTQAGNSNAVVNISAITEVGTYTVRGTIVAKSQRGFIVGDGTGYVYYYNQNYTQTDYNIGDKVQLSGSVVVYGGVFEFNNSTEITTATESNYVVEEPTVLSGAQMDTRVASTTPAQLSTYVQYEGTLTISDNHYNINGIDGASKAIGSISYPLNTDFTSLDGKIVKVTGYYVGVSSSTYYNTLIVSVEEVLETSITAEDVNIACDATSGEISYTINNPISGTSLTASEEVDWISDVIVDVTNNKVTFTTTANTGAGRSGVITLTYGSITKNVTVTQAKYAVTGYYTLATSIVSGKHYVIASGEEEDSPGVVNVMATQKDNNRGATLGTLTGSDLSVSGHAEFVIYGPDADGYYSIYDGVEGGYLYAASSSSNYLRTQATNNDNGRWEITFGNGGVASIVAQGENSRNVMQYNSGSSLFACYGSASQKPVYLYVKDNEATPTESVSVSTAGYATYCSQNALDFTDSQIKAFIGTRNGTSLEFNPINKVPANTGILLYKVGGATEQIPVATTVEDATVNCLVGVTEETTINYDDYILSRSSDGVGFYKAGTHTTLAANRAYIPASTATGIKSFAINFGDADGVKEIGNGQLTIDNAVIYNLAGQRLQKLQKGVNIIGGKKVIVK